MGEGEEEESLENGEMIWEFGTERPTMNGRDAMPTIDKSYPSDRVTRSLH